LTLDDATFDAVMSVALQFDGYRYIEDQGHSGDFSRIVTPMVDSLTFSESDDENRAVFFALQRYLHKWGGEQLPVTSKEWSCYLLLFLHLHDKPVPTRFAWPDGHTSGPVSSLEQISAAAKQVRAFFAAASARQASTDKSFDLQYYDLESYLLDVVRPRFQDSKTLTAFDFFSIVIWKANRAKTKIARRLLRRRGSLDEAVQALCADLYSAVDDEQRLSVMLSGWGFRLPMATAILTILWPDAFTVYDIRVCDQLQAFHKVADKSVSKIWPEYQAYREAVTTAVPEQELLRDKDRVLWSRNAIARLEADVKSGFGGLSTVA
jgi:hypothetical protein